ncbi:single-strand binding protein, variant [Allomyces macrogynus ATCC 38327]|uniref:Single-strand binding protein, variant n=1 Tax=Allomyces macrogynus (strain ATCC 38327) TaxID=578462 RepID=A0A0L0SKQ2_ALLM3|nr:single-strand binding protein, variant [Allomyces macrogynus ATCC 38327]|eukprot:KNE63107.1 single-strand binding protein, variant [Allomyces macrogynus ATCC 38327]
MFRRAFSTAAVAASSSTKSGTRVFPVGINRVTLLGRVARDPKEFKSSETGETTLTSFSLQTSDRKIGGADGSSTYLNQYHKIVNFDKHTHELVMKMKPGMSVLVEGKIQYSSYTDKDGNTRYSTEITPSYGGRVIIVNTEVPEGWSGGKSSSSSKDGHFGETNVEYPIEEFRH